MIQTVNGQGIPEALVANYFKSMVGRFFKILPLYEKGETTLRVYMECLRDELIGSGEVIAALDNDALFLSLIANTQTMLRLLDDPETGKTVYKQRVFGAISVCNKLSKHYGDMVRTEAEDECV